MCDSNAQRGVRNQVEWLAPHDDRFTGGHVPQELLARRPLNAPHLRVEIYVIAHHRFPSVHTARWLRKGGGTGVSAMALLRSSPPTGASGGASRHAPSFRACDSKKANWRNTWHSRQ